MNTLAYSSIGLTVPIDRAERHASRLAESVTLSVVFRRLQRLWPGKKLSTIRHIYFDRQSLRTEVDIAQALSDCGLLEAAVQRCAPLMAVLSGADLPDDTTEAVRASRKPDFEEELVEEEYLEDPSPENARRLLNAKLKALAPELTAIACLRRDLDSE